MKQSTLRKSLERSEENNVRVDARGLTWLAKSWLRQRYPAALIIEEMSVGRYGSARMDVAAVLTDPITRQGTIIGMEIKGEGDSAARLPLQGVVYSQVATQMHVLAAPSLTRACRRRAPSHWHVFDWLDDGRLNDAAWDHAKPCNNTPAALCGCLWREELQQLASASRVAAHAREPYDDVKRRVCELVPLRTIRNEVVKLLLARDWRRYDKPVVLPHEAVLDDLQAMVGADTGAAV